MVREVCGRECGGRICSGVDGKFTAFTPEVHGVKRCCGRVMAGFGIRAEERLERHRERTVSPTAPRADGVAAPTMRALADEVGASGRARAMAHAHARDHKQGDGLSRAGRAWPFSRCWRTRMAWCGAALSRRADAVKDGKFTRLRRTMVCRMMPSVRSPDDRGGRLWMGRSGEFFTQTRRS